MLRCLTPIRVHRRIKVFTDGWGREKKGSSLNPSFDADPRLGERLESRPMVVDRQSAGPTALGNGPLLLVFGRNSAVRRFDQAFVPVTAGGQFQYSRRSRRMRWVKSFRVYGQQLPRLWLISLLLQARFLSGS